MTAVIEDEEETKPGVYDFDAEFQHKIAALVLRDTMFAGRTEGLIKPSYFEDEINQVVVALAGDYYDRFKKAPSVNVWGELIKDGVLKRMIRKDQKDDLVARLKDFAKFDISDRDYVIDHVAEFARHQAVEAAIMASVGALGKKDFAKIEEMIKSAVLVGEVESADDYDFWDGIDTRLTERKAIAAGTLTRDGITTGHKDLDAYLLPHFGWGRKELSVIMGAAKAGKSMSLGEFAANASLAGFDVLYVTLEVSRKIIADRLEANLSNTLMRELSDKPHHVADEMHKLLKTKKRGKLKIREYASGTFKCSQLRRLLENYRARGQKFDLIVVDYADIMCPERPTGDQTVDARQIYIDLRAIAFEQNAAMLTATQTNRDGAKKMTAGMTDISDDFNKARTADILITINATEDEKKSGEARLFFAAARNTESGFTLRIRQDRSRMKFLMKVVNKE